MDPAAYLLPSSSVRESSGVIGQRRNDERQPRRPASLRVLVCKDESHAIHRQTPQMADIINSFPAAAKGNGTQDW